MRYLAIILLLPSLALAKSDFFLYESAGRLQMIGDYEATTHLPQLWDWEGGQSRADITRESDGLTIRWKIDVAGPDWLYVTLRDTCYGVSVHISISSTGDLSDAYYANYDALIASNDTSSGWVRKLISRFGQGEIQDISTLRVAMGAPSPDDHEALSDTRSLLYRLQDEDWKVRADAKKKLSLPRYMLQIARAIADSKLDAAQLEVINAIYGRYACDLPRPVYDRLKEVCGL